MRLGPRFTTILVSLCTATLMTACGTTASTTPAADTPTPSTASPSANCASAGGIAAGSTQQTIKVGGKARTYVLHIPTGYTGTTAVPVVVNFHGRGSDGSQQLALTGFEQVSNTNGFVLVAPDGIGGQWELPTSAKPTSDTDFVNALLANLSSRLCIDTQRVYAAGMSMGSAMVFLEACLPKRTFAAFGGVSASFYRPACDQSPPAPIIYFHGTADKVVPFNGGKVNAGPGLAERVDSVPQNMAAWANHNHCPAGPHVSDNADVELTTWNGCQANASVDYYRVTGGGHTWPGTNPTIAMFTEGFLGKTTQTVNASETMWDFFSNYTLTPP